MRKLMLLVPLLLTVPVVKAQQSEQKPLWSSGNDFLHWCDETDPLPPAQMLTVKLPTNVEWQLRSGVCDTWINGIAEGIEASEQFRPTPDYPADPEIIELEKERAKSLEDLSKTLGLSELSFKNDYFCLSDGVPTDQLRHVVIKWLKDHPTKLTEQGGLLVYAALKDTYNCTKKPGEENLFLKAASTPTPVKQPTLDKAACAKIAAQPDPFAQFGGTSTDNAICRKAYPDLYPQPTEGRPKSVCYIHSAFPEDNQPILGIIGAIAGALRSTNITGIERRALPLRRAEAAVD